MRCGLVRLMTRKCPYDARLRRKAWNSNHRGESSALNNVAESRVIGRTCAHKICRLMEKSSKIFSRVFSGSNISNKKMLSKAPFLDNWSDVYLKYSVEDKPLARRSLTKVNSGSKYELPSFVKRTRSNVGLAQQNYSTVDKTCLNSFKIRPSKPHHVLSKHKNPGYKRYSSQKVAVKRNYNTISESNKRFKSLSMRKNKLVPSKKLYVLRSPFVTYPDYDNKNYLNRMKHSLRSQHTKFDQCDKTREFVDHKVLNHLNETSYVSLCGCETCDKTFKEYKQKNQKINYLLQNKICNIINYCKKKNPFYKIYTQSSRCRVDEDCLQEFSRYGVNGWMDYLDAYKCPDISPCTIKNENQCSSPNTENKCVNTNNEHEKPAESSVNICSEQTNQNISNKVGVCGKHFEEPSNKNEATSGNPQASIIEEKQGSKDNRASFKNKDDSTTQTQDIDAPVTNYYYITNNTLNTNCCCKDGISNEPDIKNNNSTDQSHLKSCGEKKEIFVADLKTDNETTEKETLRKVYEVMMQPVYEKDFSIQETKTGKENTKASQAKTENNCIKPPTSIENNICGQGDSPTKFEPNKNLDILDFDAFMDLKFNELRKRSFGDSFRFLDELRFSEITKKPSLEKNTSNCENENLPRGENMNLQNPDCFRKTNTDNLVSPSDPPKRKLKPKKKVSLERMRAHSRLFKILNSKTSDIQIKSGKRMKPSHELGPLDHTSVFINDNAKRYQEKINILKRGPSFSQFPDSAWRDSLFGYDDKLSKTFDIMKGNKETKAVSITTDKRRDLAKYSEINIAIEKVKKRISNIINESDEDILVSSHMNKIEPSGRDRKTKLGAMYVNNQSRSPKSFNYNKKYYGTNYFENENNYLKEQKVKAENRERENRQADADRQYNHPPSSVHLNEIIEAIKENRNTDTCDNTVVTKADKRECRMNSYKRNKCYKVYRSAIAHDNMKKAPLKNNAFIFNTRTEPIFGLVNTQNLLSRENISRNFSTSSKYKPLFPNNVENKNKTGKERNLAGESIFQGNSLVPEEIEKENVKNMNRQSFCNKQTDKKVKQSDSREPPENATLEADPQENQTFTQAEYIEYQTSCKEDLYKKSIDVFAKNNKTEKNKKNEYSSSPSIPGIVERYNMKHSQDQQIFNQIENNIKHMSAKKCWKVWDPKVWEIEADISRNEFSCKGFTNNIYKNKNELNPVNQISFNEEIKVKAEYNVNNEEVKTRLNNDAGKDFNHCKLRSNNCPSVDFSRCINVGDLGLNFTSFALKKPEKVEKGRSRQDDLRKCVHGSASRINNVGEENTSMSRQAELHLRETRTVGLRPCKKNHVPPNSLRIRNSFLIDGHNTLRLATSTNTLYRRQASSGVPDNNDLQKNLASKIKNIKRIDHVDYTREEKCVSEKEAIESIKVKESYTTRNSKNGSSFVAQDSAGNDDTIKLDMCSKEVEMRKKHKAIQHGLTKQITEEMNVSGIFPEGKKAIHSKLVTVYSNKPKSKFTNLQSRVKGLESIRGTPMKDPITVQMVYETTTDHSVGEHINKAKNKAALGKVRNTATLENYNFKENTESNQEEIENDNENSDFRESKTKVWKKYDPNNTTQEMKKYFVDQKKIKTKKSRSFESSNVENKSQENRYLQWQAPKNGVLEKLIGQDKLVNTWYDDKELIPPQLNKEIKDKNSSDINIYKKKNNEYESVEIYSNSGKEQLNQIDEKSQTNKIKASSFNNESYKTEHENRDEAKSKDTATNDLPLEEEIIKENKSLEEKIKTIESKSEKPTIGESKYEIDSDSVNERGPPKEKEKTVITHFKQFRSPDNLTQTGLADNFILEASMLKVTLLKEEKETPNKDYVEIQSFESLSNNVENELNDMLSPYVKDFMVRNNPSQGGYKTELKSKEFFLNLLKLKGKTIAKSQMNDLKENSGDIDSFQDEVTDPEIKIKTGIIKGETDAKENLSHALRACIEQLYMKNVNFLVPTETSNHSHQLRASIENLYCKKYVNPREEVSETENASGALGKENPSDTEELPPKSLHNELKKNLVEKETVIDKTSEVKPPQITKAYDAITKELNKMFVKGETKIDNQEPNTRDQLARKEATSTDQFKTSTDNQDANNFYQNKSEGSQSKVEIELVKKNASIELKTEVDRPDVVTPKSSEEIRAKSEIKANNSEAQHAESQSKPIAKSYYSYDSSIKHKFSDAKTDLPSEQSEGNVAENKESAQLTKNESSKTRLASKIKFPKFKPKFFNPRVEVPETEETSNHSGEKNSSDTKELLPKPLQNELEKNLVEKEEAVIERSSEVKPPQITKAYDDAITKELNEISVKEENKLDNQQPKTSDQLERKETTLIDKFKTSTDNQDASSFIQDKFEVSQSKAETESVMKNASTEPSTITEVDRPDELMPKISEEIRSKNEIKANNSEAQHVESKSKPIAKSYYSYDSSIKHKFSDGEQSEDSVAEDKETAQPHQRNASRNRPASKIRLPIFKPKFFKRRQLSPNTVQRHESNIDLVKKIRQKYDIRSMIPKKDINEKANIQSGDRLESSTENERQIRRTPSSFYSYDSTMKTQKKIESLIKNDDADNESKLTSESAKLNDSLTNNTDKNKSNNIESLKGSEIIEQELLNPNKDKGVDKVQTLENNLIDSSPQEREASTIQSTTHKESSGTSEVVKTDLETSIEPSSEKPSKTATNYIDKFNESVLKTEKAAAQVKNTITDKTDKLENGKEKVSSVKMTKEEHFDGAAPNIQNDAKADKKNKLRKRFSKDMIVEDIKERFETKEDSTEKVKSEEQSDQKETNKVKKDAEIVRSEKSTDQSEVDKPDKPNLTVEFEKLKPKGKDLLQPPKQYVPYEPSRKPNVVLETWEKEPTYLKNLRPAYYKMAADEKRIRNYEENEKRFKNLRTLNKINSANKYSECECSRKEKWTADMCCSLEDKNENNQVDGETNLRDDNRSPHNSKNKLGRPSRTRSKDWPDSLIRKKEAVIKQPLTPRPPWRN